jgi:YfiH family protein
LDATGVLRAVALERFDWLEHGFGTRVSSRWPDPSRLAILKQVHSARILMAGAVTGNIGEGDALITDRPGLLVGVRTADCVPILLVDQKTRAVAAVHAGWRGTAQSIVGSTISNLVDRFGTEPDHVWAAIGPAIGKCCYEVGADVARQFSHWLPELGGCSLAVHLDLAGVNRLQLLQAGVPAENVFTGAPCTFCTDTLHSYRRDKDASGRMMSAIGIR